MSQRGEECRSAGKTSRRRFLKRAAALGVAAPVFAQAPKDHADSAHRPIWAYVGILQFTARPGRLHWARARDLPVRIESCDGSPRPTRIVSERYQPILYGL